MSQLVTKSMRKADPHRVQLLLDAKIRLVALCSAAAITGSLVLGGLLSFFLAPDRWHDIWLVIGPLVSVGLGAIAFSCGDRRRRGDR
jgi:hypothetical protein